MTPSVTYDDYIDRGGKLAKDAFGASFASAVASVREIMGFNEPSDERQAEAYVRAVCAAVDTDAAYGASGGVGEHVTSVAIGAFSASLQGSGGVSAYDLDMRRAIRRELQGSGLLFQGIG